MNGMGLKLFAINYLSMTVSSHLKICKPITKLSEIVGILSQKEANQIENGIAQVKKSTAVRIFV